MSCEWVQQHIDAYELGRLGERDREVLDAHLASCGACRRLLADARSADEAVRQALAWAEPDASFAGRVAAAARLSPRRWVASLAAAAAAAVLCVAALYTVARPPQEPGPRPVAPVEPAPASGSLLAGELFDSFGLPVRRIEGGRSYVVAAHAAVGFGERSVFLFAEGAEFAPAPGPEGHLFAMSVLSGTVLGQVNAQGEEVALELAPELGGAIVRTTACQFYSTGFPAHQLAVGDGPSAEALAQWPEAIRVHVFTGKLELDLGTQTLKLLAGDSCIILGGASAGPTHLLLERVAQLRLAIGTAALGRRLRYQRLRRQYARRLLELRAAKGDDAPPHLARRIAVVDELLRAHTAALSRLEAARADVFELDAAEDELRRHDALREEALDALERLIASTSSAG